MTNASQEQPVRVTPLSVRIIANLEIFAKTPIVLLAAVSAGWHHSPAILLGFLVPVRIAQPLLVLLTAGSFFFAVETLRKRSWGLDGLIAYSVLGVVNAALVWLSRSRLAYETIMAQRLVTESRMSMEAAMKIQRVISTSVYTFTFAVSAIVLYFLLTRRRVFRAARTTLVGLEEIRP